MYPNKRNKRCFIACPQYKIDAGQCDCHNNIMARQMDEEIEGCLGRSFVFRGVRYLVGEKVKVSEHYAGYKSQYNFMVGVLDLQDYSGTPIIKIEINPNDVEQEDVTDLDCWNVIEKMK